MRGVGAMLALIVLSNCARMTAFVATDFTCQAFPPIAWSKQDTPDTIAAIKQHNAGWLVLCNE
ncbi:MAG: hypothetical protein ABJL64_08840 [Rhizobiaceae bacterium]